MNLRTLTQNMMSFHNYPAITPCATSDGQPSSPSVMNRAWSLSEKDKLRS